MGIEPTFPSKLFIVNVPISDGAYDLTHIDNKQSKPLIVPYWLHRHGDDGLGRHGVIESISVSSYLSVFENFSVRCLELVCSVVSFHYLQESKPVLPHDNAYSQVSHLAPLLPPINHGISIVVE